MPLTFEERRRQTTAKLAALMLANAYIFQEQLSGIEARVRPIRTVLAERDFVTATANHWSMIIEEINYVPIFRVARDILLAMPAGIDTDGSIRGLAERALEIVSRKAALRHDLMGRIYHLLLLEAKYLGTYYTSVPAATLLMRLTLDPNNWPDTNWSNLEAVRAFKIADLACGTGTLLMAASQAITDNVVKFKVSDGISDDTLRALHKTIVEEMLHGYDVLPSAVHLTASTLALLAPETCFRKMRLYSLPMGQAESGNIYLGSIDYISEEVIRTQLDLMSGDDAGAEDVEDRRSVAPLPMLDLCVMNPPFVRSVGGNLLFGSVPNHRAAMQKELAERLKSSRLPANSTAGLGSVFAAIGDRHVKPGGRLALVLPAAVATGVAWEKTRAFLSQSYVLETVVMSHDAMRWNFSENTDLSEILFIARKLRADETVSGAGTHPTQFINLWANPATSADALAVGEAIQRGAPAPIGSPARVQHGISEIVVGSRKFGETVEIPWGEVREGSWLGCAFARTEVLRAAWFLRSGAVYQPGSATTASVPIRKLGEIAKLGPDRRDIADGFTVSAARTSYPALMGHDSEHVKSIGVEPNKWLAPRTTAAKGRPLRDVNLLWPRAGSIMIAERSRLNTQRALAVRLDDPALSNVWWPVRLNTPSQEAEKALTLWLNSTLGVLAMAAHRVPTEGPWVQFKKPTVEALPVLDPTALTAAQLRQLAAAYDSVSALELQPLGKIGEDATRAAIDDALGRVLGLPPLGRLRTLLGEEPVMTGRQRTVELPTSDTTDALQLELL